MVLLEKFYSFTEVFFEDESLKGRFQPLLDDVIKRLPDKPPFPVIGVFLIASRPLVIEHLKGLDPRKKAPSDVTPESRDGHCFTGIDENGDINEYHISIITDFLEPKSDDYIKGLIIHEISHMIYVWRLLQKKKSDYAKLGRKAKQIRFNQIGQIDIIPETKEYYEKENSVNAEAIRLGFEKEIRALEEEFANIK